MLAKDLMKNSPATEISLTGYKVVSKGDAALGDHGYDLTAEEGTSWGFVAKDKDPKSFSSGNAFRPLALQPKPLHPNFTWMWEVQLACGPCQIEHQETLSHCEPGRETRSQ